MEVAELDLQAALDQPFPGLRPFETAESFLFFGRQEHTRDLLRRLTSSRLLAVVGTSGSGKSSLVRAGLLPSLHSGHLAGAGTRWRIAVMRPGNAPLEELAKAMSQSGLSLPNPKDLQPMLRATSLGVVEVARRSGLRSDENVLIVVDQFEELFRFRSQQESEHGGAEASLFVAALLEAVEQYQISIYVVLTMRSDFLGDCAKFLSLPEALNRSQYLIPRLTRQQRREAIEGPLRVAGTTISSRLVQQLLNDAGDDPDQLPILQHVLMSTYRVWKRSSEGTIDLWHYEEAGGIVDALNRHAESVYKDLSLHLALNHGLVERLFRCLTTSEGGRAIRRPMRLDRILAVLEAETDPAQQDVIKTVIRRFAASENSFLVSSDAGSPPQAVIDISHESLIRKWETLRHWVTLEAESAEWYRSVLRGAQIHKRGDAGFWRNPELGRALRLRKKESWNAAWAELYAPAGGFLEAMRYLDQSQRAQTRRRSVVGGVVIFLIIAVGVGYWKYRTTIVENQKQQIALRAELNAALLGTDNANSTILLLHEQLKKTSNQQERGQLAAKLKQAETELEQLQQQNKQIQLSIRRGQKQGSDNDPVLKAATDQIDWLQNELNGVRKERDDALARLKRSSGGVIQDKFIPPPGQQQNVPPNPKQNTSPEKEKDPKIQRRSVPGLGTSRRP